MTTKPIQRPSIEYSLADHCNLSCYGCDHSSPLLARRLADHGRFEADLQALRGVLKVHRLYLIGGEPLLHPDLPHFVSTAMRSEVADGVTLVTNGVLLHTMSDEVWSLLAGLDVTLYPGVTLRLSLQEIAAKAREFGVDLRVRRRDEFRHTVLVAPVSSGRLVQQIFDACRIAHDYGCHAIHDGRYYKCSIAPTVPDRLRLLQRTAAGWEHDGVPLHNNPSLRDDLERYLADCRPLASCTYCLGTSGRTLPHRQMNAHGRRQWLSNMSVEPTSLIDPEKLAPVRAGSIAPSPSWRSRPASDLLAWLASKTLGLVARTHHD